jgi:hypothetical protein
MDKRKSAKYWVLCRKICFLKSDKNQKTNDKAGYYVIKIN